MELVKIEEIAELARMQYYDIWNDAESVGRDPKIYCHWTAGGWYQLFGDYHINIDGDGSVYLSTRNLATVLPATYCRNTGSIAITLCSAVGAQCWADGTVDLGTNPPTDKQINAMSMTIAHLAKALNLTIDIAHVMTHGEAANNEDGLYLHEPYAVWSDPQPSDGITRWDLAVLKEGDQFRSGGDQLRGNAIWYQHNYYM